MAKKVRSYSTNDILNWNFKKSDLPEKWVKHLGELNERFLMYVDGEGASGKTEYALQFAKMCAINIGKVRLNNVEQGKHQQIQDSVKRNDFKGTIKPGLFQYDNMRVFEDFDKKLSRPNSGKVIMIDSISYWPLNHSQIKYLFDQYKKKSFMLNAYRADFGKNKAIRHLCDIKINVENYIAKVEGSRFGGGESFDIWPEKHIKTPLSQQTLFDNGSK